MNKITFKIVSKWPNNAVYHATDGKKTIPFNIETVHDGIGSLKRVECSRIGYFEEYKMQDIKNRIVNLFN